MSVKIVKALGIDRASSIANESEFLKEVSFYSSWPEECVNCDCGDLAVNYRMAKGFEFFAIVCPKCGFRLQFGQYKEGGGFFLKDWEPPYSESSDEDDDRSSKKKAAPKENYKRRAAKEEVEEAEVVEEEEAAPRRQAAPSRRQELLDRYSKKK
ncbi:MAG: hypothetical protein DRN81_02950 [Thermoproteota archaeon]|nr:MAG: hypothetical protein DRN81_02950 [Candidatus Korarchaeota archaeon]